MVSVARRHSRRKGVTRSCWTLAKGCLLGALLLAPTGVAAFDILGLIGGEKPPVPSPHALAYAVTFDIPGAPSDLVTTLKEVSTLHRLRQDAPPDGESLVRRAAADLVPLLDALWGSGYYNATLSIEVAGVALRVGEPVPPRAAAAAEAFRARAAVPVRVVIAAGRIYRLRDVAVVDARTGQPFPPDVLPPHLIKIAPGAPARAADIRVARVALVDHFRARSHPFVKVSATEPVVDHRHKVMDIRIAIDPGPKAPFGDVSVAGDSAVDPAVVRSHVYVEPGDPYSPAVVADTRKFVSALPAIGSVRVREAERLDADGRLPVSVEVSDRKPRVIGFHAQYSSIDGPAVRAYWQHRNLFGGAESLRLEGELFIPPRTNSSFADTVEHFGWSDLGGRFRTSFVKPALHGTRNDLLLDAMFERDRTGGDRYGGYTTTNGRASAAIRHRFSGSFSAQAGLSGEIGETHDTLGTVDYRLIGLPVSLTYDSTDHPLDPTRGLRIAAGVAPYPSFLGSSVGMVEGQLRASAYRSLDDEARIVLAARVGIGSVTGAGLAAIPANHRFYAGGGGSVRGYRYRSLSPLGPTGEVIGGRSLLEASFEARFKITETIGIVPFVDAGGAFESSYPDFEVPLRYAAGVGLRYHTPVGPIRLDVAFPLNRRPGDESYAIYVGIGQAF